MTDCVHDMDVETCAYCKPRKAPTWPAKFDGTCGACGQPVQEGDPVRWARDGIHVEHERHG